jgi:general secretion pathway protein N
VLVFVVLLVATLPARVLVDRIPMVHATGVGGSLWSGHAETLAVHGVSLGRAQWRLFALPLIRGQLKIEANVNPPGGKGTARCVITFSRDVTCSHVDASLPLQSLPMRNLPEGWSGHLVADLSHLDVKQGWPVAATGSIDVQDVHKMAGGGMSPFGSFRVEFPGPDMEPAQGLVGALKDTGGPLSVVGTLRLAPDRTYVIDGRVAARSDAPADVARAIEYLGFPDAQGRREFSVAGSL